MRLISDKIAENGDARNEEKVEQASASANSGDDHAAGEHFQPRKADMDMEHDMPGASVEQVRQAFSRPVNVLRHGSG